MKRVNAMMRQADPVPAPEQAWGPLSYVSGGAYGPALLFSLYPIKITCQYILIVTFMQGMCLKITCISVILVMISEKAGSEARGHPLSCHLEIKGGPL
jgi:hypothetical protein